MNDLYNFSHLHQQRFPKLPLCTKLQASSTCASLIKTHREYLNFHYVVCLICSYSFSEKYIPLGKDNFLLYNLF